jgi:hypothetical protein
VNRKDSKFYPEPGCARQRFEIIERSYNCASSIAATAQPSGDRERLIEAAGEGGVLGEYEDWRLVLSSRKFDAAGLKKANGLLHDTLDAAGFTLEETPPVVILQANDPFVQARRKIFEKTKSDEGMRFGGQSIGNRFIEDAYPYLVS